ncbi:tetratricopeptide repeat protein [Rahnella selenatireducens]|uniref:tetratricopeptide repeat protein n=1 Tax=Rahnella selenatireducens TaxID=3389797 RepID=UPI003968F50C
MKNPAFFLQKQLKKNNPTAIYNLGHIYNYGLGVNQDYTLAASFYLQATKLGSPEAKNSLALFYAQGLGGLTINRGQALKLIIDSAKQGYPEAQNNLAILYSDGVDELPVDNQQAYAWYSVAFKNGKESAKESREIIAKKLTHTEYLQANRLACEYIKKYESPDF